MNLKKSYFMGLDTSAYTTSLAIVDSEENLVYDQRIQLPVKAGELGLRQSNAVFEHLSNMPDLYPEELEYCKEGKLKALAASTRPRPVPGSYMPVFKVGESFGRFFAQNAGLIFLSSTHQEGHIMAGLWAAKLEPGPYLVLHLSGGTTELLMVEETKPGFLEIELVGESEDLNAGQFIDRLGKLMKLPFPSGPALEKMAKKSSGESVTLPVAVKGNKISFSGPASHAERLLNKGCNKQNIARAIEECVAVSLARAISNTQPSLKLFNAILAVGGVTANLQVRKRLKEELADTQILYAPPGLSTDNAVGLAVQAARQYRYKTI